mgnify:FL=1
MILNLAAALPAGTIMQPGHEVFWVYVASAIPFWVGLRKVRTGALIVVGGLALQGIMVLANRVPLTEATLTQVVVREAAIASIEATLVAEQAWHLRDLYDEIAQSIRQIADWSRPRLTPSSERLLQIHSLTVATVVRLRSEFEIGDPSPQQPPT